MIDRAAGLVLAAFDDYNASFADITRRGRRRFEAGDRAGMRADVNARLALYDDSAEEAIAQLEALLANRLFSHTLWREIRTAFAVRLAGRQDAALCMTFFNTLTRRLFKTRGVDEHIEFAAPDLPPPKTEAHAGVQRLAVATNLDQVFEQLLTASGFRLPMPTLIADSRLLASRLLTVAEQEGIAQDIESLEFLESVFYREGRAYRVGRARCGSHFIPCVIALCADAGTIHVDALLTNERQVSILFGFTFSYFLADLPVVSAALTFLRTLLPSKPVDELYTVLGRIKQGKTERYRAFVSHLDGVKEERLVEAEGQKGMVMLVFTLPSWPLVFKVIRDRLAPIKKFGRSRVTEGYRLVFGHDRVGRLLDVQEFQRLALPRGSFSTELTDALMRECNRTVIFDGDRVVIGHCYIERRLRPLDLYLAEVDEEAARQAVLDYGQALKDLARSNIFAGDLLPKNFGVTRSGRVIFYDYDEIRLMTECRFRFLPDADDDLLVLSDEPWFAIGDGDIFPEQFPRFMGLRRDLMVLLHETHPELFDPNWWQRLARRLAEGEGLDVPPYNDEARLGPIVPAEVRDRESD